jgi:hypothetical protein
MDGIISKARSKDMKKKVQLILYLILISINIIGCKWIGSQNESLNETSGSSTSWTDEKNTECNFKKGQTITFSYESNVNSGEISIQLLNPENEVVLEFETNKEGKLEQEITESGTYILSVKGNEFNGSYSVEW